MRKQCPEIGWGEWELLDTGSEHVMAIRYNWQGRSLVMINNFSSEPQKCQLTKSLKSHSTLVNLFDNSQTQAGNNGEYTVQLAGYGYSWYRLKN
jgi:maltose alpha-D-glucosyltransferase/alpha-amylase